MRIVVADERADVRSRQSHWIASAFPDSQVIAAASLTGVVRTLVEHHPVHVAVLDLGLGGLEGIATVRRFFPEVRCIAVGTPRPATIEEALRLGIRGFLPANTARDEFVAALAAVLNGGRHIPAPGASVPASLGLAALAVLTPREKDILLLLRDGLPNKVIANRLAVSEVTVKSHLGNVFRKLGVQNRLQALRVVVEAGRA